MVAAGSVGDKPWAQAGDRRTAHASSRLACGRRRWRSPAWTAATITIRTAVTPTFRASSGRPRANEAGRPPPAGRFICGAGAAWADAAVDPAAAVAESAGAVVDGLATAFGPRPGGGPPRALTIDWPTGVSETP